MDTIATMTRSDRRDLFRIVADGTPEALGASLSPAVIEKDFWVCWLLDKLFGLPEAMVVGDSPKLLFKGGTSLSKVFHAIQRFSEDIDVSVEPGHLGIDLEVLRDEKLSKTRRKALGEQLRAECARHVCETIRPSLSASLRAVLGDEPWLADGAPHEPDPILLLAYPRAVDPDEGLLPEVRLEFGARADLHPWTHGDVRPYIWDVRPDVYDRSIERARVLVPTLAAERTFWEKVTLLHVENRRPHDSSAPLPRAWRRISRHGYDLVMLAEAGVADRALLEDALFRRVCDTKHLWFRSGFSDYDTLERGDVMVVPRGDLRDAFVRDYVQMQSMFFAKPPSIDELLTKLQELERRIGAGADPDPAADGQSTT